MKSILSRVFLLQNISCLLLLSGFVQAQNIPDNNAYPTGTVTPVLPANFTAGIKVNYVRTTSLKQPITVESSINPTDYNQTSVQTQYLDGLGRAIQKVDHFASVYANDVVNVVKYDNLGRDTWHFLPYAKAEGTATDNGKFKLTAYSDQNNFYKNTPGFEEDNYFYTQTNYEPSPLNRVVKSLPQGSSWVGNNRGTTITEYPLQASSGLRIFTIGYAPGSMPVASGTYAAADLRVKVITDEDGNFTQEYTTKDNLVVIKNVGKTGSGQTIMTYYVYDDFGLLRFVIPPKALVWLVNNNWTMTPAIASELCFNYEYDGRLRQIVSKTPGAGTQYLIYNNRDELILTQTSTQAAKGEWLFNKYDALGRLIQTGVYNNTSTHASLQALVNANTPGSDAFLAYLFNTTIYGNAAYVATFPTAKVLTTNYYDDYTFTTRTYDANFMNGLPAGWNTAVSKETTNLLTGTKVVVLDGATTPTELFSVHFYNDRGLLLQTQAQNHKGGWNYTTTSYDFLGQKLGTYTEVNNPVATNNTKIKTVELFFHDHAGRLTGATHNINDLNLQVSPTNFNYDELGRLANKNFSNGMTPSLEFDYNVRGWLTGINKNYSLYASTDQTFGMEISYDYGYSTNYFNGNIAGIKWRNSGKFREERSYGYTYDAYNRLKSGDFVMQYNTGSTIIPWSSSSKDFSASNMLYDENGNLTSMKQMGHNVAGQKIVLDDLTYGYNANSNKLASVSESASSQSKSPTTYDKLGDFRDVAGITDYTYDQNGSVLTDANKSLTFTYDELVNKTKKVTKGAQSVNYLYDANGTKLQKKVTGGAATVTTDYINAAVYIDNSLSFVNHAEGRIRYVPTATNKYLYDYYIKDHLGSTRSVVCYTQGAITGFAKTTSPESNEVKYIATSEPELAAKENQLFDNVDITRSAKPINKTATDNYVAKISSKNSKTMIGPDITLKVMAGDTVKISAEALYIPEKTNTNAIAEDVIKNFITAFTTLPSLAAEGVSTIANSNTKDLANAVLNLQKKNAAVDGPNAFLNYVLYDEYMNLVPEASGALQVKNKEGWQTLETDKIAIPQNGFLRVFSNNMEAAPVSINNTTLSAIPGVLVEEYNYYPYGLVFGASSAASTIKKTDYLYNGKELQHNEFGDGNGLELEDYGARLYDPQIGRWTTPDDYAEITVNESPYCYVGNKPISRTDPDGNTWWDVIAGIGTALADNMVGTNTAESYPATNNSDFNKGNQIGQAASLLFGTTEIAVGDAMMGMGGGSFIASGGSTAPVSVPVAVGGAALTGHGIAVTAKAAANLMTGNGQKPENKTTTESRTFNGKQDTQSQTDKQAFNKAKDQNGVPTSQQPKKQYTTPDNKTGKPLRTYDYKNAKGENVTIRKDSKVTYPDGGSQGDHYNAGETGEKLKQHHNIQPIP